MIDGSRWPGPTLRSAGFRRPAAMYSRLLSLRRDPRLQLPGRVLRHNRALEAMLVTTQAAGVIASIVVARSVGPAGRGTLLTITVWGQILGWLAAFSLDKAVVVLTSGKDRVSSPDDALRTVRLPVLGLSAWPWSPVSCSAVISSPAHG